MQLHSLLAMAAVSLFGFFQPTVSQPATSSLPSAYGGVTVALGVLQKSAPKNQVEILSLTAESLAKGRKIGPHVLIEMDLRLQGVDADAAKASMKAFEKALDERAQVTDAPDLGYMATVGALTRMKFRPAHEKGFANAYRTTIKVAIPAEAIGKVTSVRQAPKTATVEASFKSAVGPYVRAIAARDHVGLAPLSLQTSTAPGEAKSRGSRWTVRSKRAAKNGKLVPVTAVQVANFLYLLESESKQIVVSKVKLGAPKGSAFGEFAAQLAERE